MMGRLQHSSVHPPLHSSNSNSTHTLNASLLLLLLIIIIMLQAHSQNSNQHSPYSTLYCSASPDRADGSTLLDSLLFGDCDDAAAFATADNLSSCVQYLEPILRGMFSTLPSATARHTQTCCVQHHHPAGFGAGFVITAALALPADLGLKQWQLHDGSPVAAVNRLYELVQQHQRVQEAREVAHDELHKAKASLLHCMQYRWWCPPHNLGPAATDDT